MKLQINSCVRIYPVKTLQPQQLITAGDPVMGTQTTENRTFRSLATEIRSPRQVLAPVAMAFFFVLFLTCAFSSGPLSASEASKNHPSAQPEAAYSPSTGAVDLLTLSWRNVSLQRAATRLGRSTGRHLMLDRRVNPDQKVSLDTTGATLRQVLDAIADQQKIGFVDLKEMIYLGPDATCRDLRTVIALRETEVTLLPKPQQKAFKRSAPLSWPRLVAPRALVRKIVSRAGKQLLHADRIPHDLWPEGGLPAMSLTRQLTLLLAGFDATFSVSAQTNSIEIVPLSTPSTIRRTYEFPPNRLSALNQFRKTLPPAAVKIQEHTVILEGRWEDHQRLQALFATLPAESRRTHRQVEHRQTFTLKVKDQPAGPLIDHLASRLDLEVDWRLDAIEAAEIRLTDPVSFSVEGANLEELLKAILEPIGLQFLREGSRVRIFPSKP